ncbi:MAG: MFS transporter, partial [Candidatus Heimdallarchaeaceae archaeon]
MSIVKKTNKKNIFLFSFFDVANTVYSQIIQSTIILRYIQIIGQKEYGMTYDGATFFFTTVQALSQILVIALIPLFGAMMDRMGKRKPWVISITALTLITSSLLWIKKDLVVVMTLFILANLSYWAALSAYDAMIPTIAAEKDIGKTSGFAMGLGWVSIIPAIGLLLLMNSIYSPLGDPNADPTAHVVNGNVWIRPVNYGYYGEWLTYVAAAVLFLLFMIPFFFTKEKTRPKEKMKFKHLVRDSFGQLYRTFRDIRQHKNMFLFIIGFFFIVDVANTANLIILNVLRDGIGFPESQSLILELPVVVLAIIIIPIIGWLGDKIGPKVTAYIVGSLYLVGMT